MMNYNSYMGKLEDVEEKSRIENGYSHIVYNVFDFALEDRYRLVDTSTIVRGNDKRQFPLNLIAVPDFFVTSKEYTYKKGNGNGVYACVEVKFNDKDVMNPDRLANSKKGGEESVGYIQIYNKVIYTNGWIWRYYINEDKNSPEWEINFRKHPTNKEYGKLLERLCSIDWEEEERK